jgi:hypothetical protein
MTAQTLGSLVVESRVGSLTIVEDLYKLEDIGYGLLSSTVATKMDQIGFQGGKESLLRRVVVRVGGIQSDFGCSKVGRRHEFLHCMVELGEIECLYLQYFREEYV